MYVTGLITKATPGMLRAIMELSFTSSKWEIDISADIRSDRGINIGMRV